MGLCTTHGDGGLGTTPGTQAEDHPGEMSTGLGTTVGSQGQGGGLSWDMDMGLGRWAP